jgi:hypothetical protein
MAEERNDIDLRMAEGGNDIDLRMAEGGNDIDLRMARLLKRYIILANILVGNV